MPDSDPVTAALAVPGFDALDALGEVDVGILCVAPDGRIVYANAAWAAVLRADPAAYVGRDFWAAFPAMRGTAEEEALRETARAGHPCAFRMAYDDGRIVGTFDVRARRSPDGLLVLTVQDVSGQLRLQREHERLLESIGEGLFVTDPDWRLTYLNSAAVRATGLRRLDVLGRMLWDVVPTVADTAIGEACREAMRVRAGRSARSVPVARVPGGPPEGIFDARAYPVDGGGLLVLFREVSGREQQARELAERSAENERLRELARAMAAISDSDALLDALCTAAARLCHADGATVAEVEGEEGVFVAAHAHPPVVLGHRFPLAGTLTGRILDDQRRSGHAELLRASSGDADDAAYNPWLRDGRRVAHILLAPLAAHGDLLGVLAVSRAEGEPPFGDAEAMRLRVVADHASLALWKAHLVEEAQAASETKSNFLAAVSHELRTPLTALTGYGELLADEIVGPLTDDQGEVVERMRAVTHQLTGMIEEILTYSSLEAGRERVRLRPVALDAVLRGVAAVAEPLAEGKALALAIEAAPDLPPLVSDPDKLRQILVNLVGNGIKFTERGSVRLVIDAADGRMRFAVADTGVGIARGDLGRLFQPFTQLDTGLTRRFGGTGLGLYISQRLAHLLGGQIVVTSTPQVGSVFTLVLPVGDASAVQPDEVAPWEAGGAD